MAKAGRTKADKRHMDLVASLGCVACRNMGYGASPAQLHHIRNGQGMGQRAGHKQVIPLCPRHHMATYPTGIHANTPAWEAQHGTEIELLAQVLQELIQLESSIV